MTDQSPTPVPTTTPRRPRPVLLLVALIAGLNAFTAAGDLLNILPAVAVTYVALISIVVAAVGGVLVQGAVTPLSAPQDARGQDLVPQWQAISAVRSAARVGAREGLAGVTIQP